MRTIKSNFVVSTRELNDDKVLMVTDYPAVIGHFLMNWTQILQYHRSVTIIVVFHTGESAKIDLPKGIARQEQIKEIDELVWWCKKLVSAPLGRDPWFLYSRK